MDDHPRPSAISLQPKQPSSYKTPSTQPPPPRGARDGGLVVSELDRDTLAGWLVEARVIAEEAGARTADYIIANRIPRPAVWLLHRLPAFLAALLVMAGGNDVVRLRRLGAVQTDVDRVTRRARQRAALVVLMPLAVVIVAADFPASAGLTQPSTVCPDGDWCSLSTL